MNSPHPSALQATIAIGGMTCGSCEILLEKELSVIPGILSVSVNHRTGIATLTADAASPPSTEEIERVIRDAGYCTGDACDVPAESSKRKWLEIGASLLIVLALWKLLTTFHIIAFVPSISSSLSIGGIFLIGLVAGTSSCLAVTGGLLLAVAAKYHEVHPQRRGWQKMVPLLQFNAGRLVSYFLLGGVVGMIGKAFTFSAGATVAINIVVALVMLSIALSILQILPKSWSVLRPPKFLSRRIAALAESDSPAAPLALGALTFFLPCGFTQSLQLVALASGNFFTGALTMGVFALGTLPSLLGISALSATMKGTGSRLFLRFSGTVVLFLALFNLQSALAVAGVDPLVFLQSHPAGQAPAVVAGGVQDIAMRVTSYGYEPSELTVRAGVPVRWTIDGTQAGGCTGGFVVPALGISKILDHGPNVFEFTVPQSGRIGFSCSMGMVRGTLNVL